LFFNAGTPAVACNTTGQLTQKRPPPRKSASDSYPR